MKNKFLHLSFEKNLFFSEAVNNAYKHSNGELILVLNSDVILKENFLQEINEVIKREPDSDCLGVTLKRPDGLIDSKGIKAGLSMRPVDVKENSGNLIGPAGSAFVITKRFAEKLVKKYGNILDPEISFFYADLAFAYQLKKENAVFKVLNQAVAIHKRSASTPKYNSIFPFAYCRLTKEYKELLIENRRAFLKKYFKLKNDLYKMPFISAYNLLCRIFLKDFFNFKN
ncbi:MAG: hypothetical protein ACD_79C00654G0007 [uncultured bacterium]|nr:MAG: hypothetical protein ACD_79C00654G0007 [uncultured bacterium]